MGVLLGIVNISIGLYILWQVHRHQRLFRRCQHPPKITWHYPMVFGFLLTGVLCVGVSLFNHCQNDVLDVALWLGGLIIMPLLPQKKPTGAKQNER